jgi:threonine dehydrogenase-like Zn-dependent dehydrogenase
MRATVMYGARDVGIENVPCPRLEEPTDAIIRVTRACICGSDLWPYRSLPHSENGRVMGHEAIGVVEDIGTDVRTLKQGDLVVMPFAFRTAPASSVKSGCTLPASTAASSATRWSPERRRRRSVFPRRMGRSPGCRSAKTPR